MIRYSTIVLLTFALSQFARAQITINYSGSSGESNIVNSLGQAINGDTVSIGTFDSGFDPKANASNLSALQANWLSFDSTTTRALPLPPATGVDGRFAAISPAVNNSLFDNPPFYLFITEPNGSGGVSEYGLYSSNNPLWVFPAHNAGPPGNSFGLSTDEVNQFVFGSSITTTGTPDTPGSLQTFATPVPEPGVLSILGVGLALRLWRRRNR